MAIQASVHQHIEPKGREEAWVHVEGWTCFGFLAGVRVCYVMCGQEEGLSLVVEEERGRVQSKMKAVVDEAKAAGVRVVTDQATTPSLAALTSALDSYFFALVAAQGERVQMVRWHLGVWL